MPQKRMSLADRRRQALEQLEEPDETSASLEAGDAATTQPAATAPADAAPADQPAAQPARRRKTIEEVAPYLVDQPVKKTRKTTQQRTKEQGKVALGLYFPNVDDLEEARRAFVTDFWEHDGPDTFAEWISQAILRHAKLSHTQRAELAQPRRTRQTGVKGKLRKIDVRPEVSEAVEKGIADDRTKLRRQITISGWCQDAVLAAIDATKRRTTGELMQIDGPLPPRLRK